jgi:hypothetical protein
MTPEMAERVAGAVLASLDGWMEAAEEIAEAAIPATGNRARALHLKQSMAQAKLSLLHVLGPNPPLTPP